MDIRNRAAKNIEELFRPFSYKVDIMSTKYAVCIALQNLGGDDTRAIYELHFNDRPRFFGVSSLEFPQSAKAELTFMKKWSSATDVTLLEDKDPYFLFELKEPFGIHFVKS